MREHALLPGRARASTMRTLLSLIVILSVGTVAWFLWGGNSVRQAASVPAGPPAVPVEASAADSLEQVAPQELAEQAEQAAEAPSTQTLRREEAQTPGTSAAATILSVSVLAREDDTPRAGSRVRIASSGDSDDFLATWLGGPADEDASTDAEGRARFEVQAGVAINVRAWDGDLSSWSEVKVEPLAVGEERAVTLHLRTRPDVLVRGRVFAREGGAALPDALVQARETNSSWNPDGRTTTSHRVLSETHSDSSGDFQLDVRSWRLPHGFVQLDGFGPALFSLERGHDQRDQAQRIPLEREGILMGRVVGFDPSHELVIRARVEGWRLAEATGSLDVYVGDMHFDAPLDAQGLYELAGLPPGVDLVLELRNASETLRAKGEALNLDPGERRVLDWFAGSGVLVTGSIRLVPEDAPLTGQDLWLVPGSRASAQLDGQDGFSAVATSDEMGRFRFEDVAPGAWFLNTAPLANRWQAPEPDAVASLGLSFELNEGERERELRLEAYRGLMIEGSVLDADGMPADAVRVHGSNGDLDVWLDTPAPNGKFTLGPLVPGSFELQAHSSATESAASPAVWVEAGAQDVVLRLGRGGLLHGSLVEASSRDPIGGRVVVTREGSGLEGWLMTMAQPDGSFSMSGREPGRYAVLGRAGKLVGLAEGVLVNVGADNPPVEIPLRPGGTLSVQSSLGWPSQWFFVDRGAARLEFSMINEQGTGESVLPVGTYDVLVQGQDPEGGRREARFRVELFAGEVSTLEVGVEDL